eukprot:TRINITY_DN5388_c0_g3_i1.p1 TRINITY_DN5388_c0_g3~~TRINITY_DN5388_c0_g3_i1.p1  ORF type:complete len:414 (+),score=61.49 TRINITY_DN5388_c0_g3_i1:53-1294(+)
MSLAYLAPMIRRPLCSRPVLRTSTIGSLLSLRSAASGSKTSPVVDQSHLWGTPIAESVGTANLNWAELGFDYVPTNGHVRYVYKDRQWDAGTFERDPYISVHILANVFHYGQALFEGFKVYNTKDGGVASFLDGASFSRMEYGCQRFQIKSPSKEMWEGAIDEVVQANLSFVPPYGTGGALYMRPFIFGSGPRLGLGPAKEYTFAVFANPVGSYYKQGSDVKPIDALVNDDYDRAAPQGCGDVKAAGNYAADLESMVVSKKKGFFVSLYLDAAERKYIEEFNTSNFVAITKDGRYITPLAPRSVLKSNTNAALKQIAIDMGLQVEERRIDFEAEVDTFAEVGAVGTAVVVTPIGSLTRGDRVWRFQPPTVLKELRDRVQAIQYGEAPDTHGWLRPITPVASFMSSVMSVYPAL